LVDTPQTTVQHDPAYNSGYSSGRGNLSVVYRFDVTDYNNWAKAIPSPQIGYDTNGSVVFQRDALNHRTNIGYTDSFSDGVSRNTFAYPTTVTDPDNYSSYTQYHYNIGAVTRTQDPKGAVVTREYDAAGRIQWIRTPFNGAWQFWAYPDRGDAVQNQTTIQNGANAYYSIVTFDGAGRIRSSGGDLPGSTGLYHGQFTLYDIMGRPSQQSNPAEMTAWWAPTGEDSSWTWSYQTYDWKGRPLLTTNQDGTTTESSYGGCGCAGGEVTTVRDERGRRRRMSKDVLGRLTKVEELGWDQSIYSTTTYAYNARDQIKSINQAGLSPRTFVYDGFGRLYQRTTPEQGVTSYSYNADDTTQTVTDARGATATFGYNNRHLMTSITFGVPAGVSPTANVSFGYDEAGNRTSMNDGLGWASYQYNTLSQMISESRYFNEIGAAYTTSYGYNLAGELTSITTPWNEAISYGRDAMGRVTGVTGYSGTLPYASGLQYRASGGIKQMTYGNGRVLSVSYDSRMRMNQWNVGNVMGWEYRYDTPNIHENTNRVAYARNLYDPTLDRSYDYDHVGRMWASHSGQEALGHTGLGSWSPANGPYAQNQSFDVYGNMTQRNGWGTTNSSYPFITFVNNRMPTNPVTGAVMQYDAAGNLTSDGTESFTYDATGQQTFASATNLSQYYDGDGLRIKKIEYGATSFYIRSSVLGNQVLAEIYGGSWWRLYTYLGGQALVMQQGGQIRYVHSDPITKSQRVTDYYGNVVSTVDMDPWGGETSRSNNQSMISQRYTTYERDGNGGDEAQMRRYQSRWIRFSQPDPWDGSYDMTDPQSFNRYSYVGNDPVNFTDPTGLGECTFDAEGNCVVAYEDLGVESISGDFLSLWWGQIFGNDQIQNPPYPISEPQNPGQVFDDSSLGPPPPMPDPNCGVNPITNEPGFTRNPRGVPGHLRPGVRGQGFFHAPRASGIPHQGLDISGRVGDPVHANLAGTVNFRGVAGAAGNLVIIDHGDGLVTRYGHLSAFAPGIQAGVEVEEGQVIGSVGHTGNAEGQPRSEDHVHFGVQMNSRTIDPEPYLNSPCP
jgi:RHS repeat-associated protein